MKIEYRASFLKDIRKIKDSVTKKQVLEIISQTKEAKHLADIENLKKLKGRDDYYRIRAGDYRLGLILDGEVLIFVRFLHRKDIYRYFP